jgi:Fur family ferric uptake transcriptional regulator
MSKVCEKDIERIKKKVQESGYKLTLQRRAVVDVIINNEGKHLTIEEIYDIVKESCPEIGLATVYRTILLLEQQNIVTKLNIGDNCNRYELVHIEEEHQHHHLICRKCKNVIEVDDDLLETLEANIEKKYKFRIQDHTLKFYGLCSECLKHENNKEEGSK